MTMVHGQLSFDVKPIKPPSGDARLVGTIRIRGALNVDSDLDHGDMLLVTVAGPDGEVLASCEAAITAPPHFVPIEDIDDFGDVGTFVADQTEVLGR